MNLVKIAGLLTLSAATVVGVSLVPTTAQAAEEAESDENIALENEGAEVDEGATAESAEAIHPYRRYRRFPPRYYYPYYSPYYYPYRYSPYYYPYYYHRPYPYRYYYGPRYNYWW